MNKIKIILLTLLYGITDFYYVFKEDIKDNPVPKDYEKEIK